MVLDSGCEGSRFKPGQSTCVIDSKTCSDPNVTNQGKNAKQYMRYNGIMVLQSVTQEFRKQSH